MSDCSICVEFLAAYFVSVAVGILFTFIFGLNGASEKQILILIAKSVFWPILIVSVLVRGVRFWWEERQ